MLMVWEQTFNFRIDFKHGFPLNIFQGKKKISEREILNWLPFIKEEK